MKRGKNKGKKNTIIHAFLRAEGVTKLNFAENSKELLEEAHFERRNCPPLPLPVDLPSIHLSMSIGCQEISYCFLLQ